MRASALGLVAGLVAGLALAFGGFGQFLVVLLFGAIGLLVGRIVDGEVDLSWLDRGLRERGRARREAQADRDGFAAGDKRRRRP